jgi:diacylglycerol kinase family enzyme
MADDADPTAWTQAPLAGLAVARPRLRRVEAVVNPMSGSVGPGAAEALEALLAKHGLGARVCEASGRELPLAIRAAIDAAPDLVVVLAGDGTAAMAARRAGPDGPLVAPLPGGTMNMLPHALYGVTGWRESLDAALEQGEERMVSGGEVDGRPFYVAAILGAPALWARAREAMRKGRLDLALARARTAISRTFTGPLHYRLDDGFEGGAEALSLVCPLVSRRLESEIALEAAALDPRSAAEVFRLGFNALTSDWRNDPSVTVRPTLGVQAWARGSIPATLDGEPRRLPSTVEMRFLPRAFRALAPASLVPVAPVPGILPA